MPHTTRRRKHPSQHRKRLQVTDSSGWTHVTTAGNARHLNRQPHDQDNAIPGNSEQEELVGSPLAPAEAPRSVTLPVLQRQLNEYRQRWEDSASWASVEEALRRALPLSLGAVSEDAEISVVCIGLGSPSGFLRGGWVDRRSVSMYQLAALASVMGFVENHIPIHSYKVYAQDPVFNSLDKSLLESLSITVLETPSAFEKVSSRTLLFCPGAERRHLELLLARDPAIVFGGPLEDMNSDVVGQFVRARDSVQLPLFEEREHAFWRMRVYYPRNGHA
ncbi:SRR1 family protein [Aspergillus lucknowensis]|uniref:SRR1-like domain-containing protein n=1 Tax=Aspergillus lucknowensis TaxID=176173 RepID=A0ABR4LVH4_9EURO